MQLQNIASTVQQPLEFKKTLENLEAIEKGCLNQKYQNTAGFQVEIVKMFFKISNLLGSNNDMRMKVDEFTTYIDKLMENYDLLNKEIFTPSPIQTLQKQQSGDLKKENSKDKIKKDLENYKKKNTMLQNKLAKNF